MVLLGAARTVPPTGGDDVHRERQTGGRPHVEGPVVNEWTLERAAPVVEKETKKSPRTAPAVKRGTLRFQFEDPARHKGVNGRLTLSILRLPKDA
ncbi:unnamed protein product, partial [Ostreobium quekettii]